MGGIHACVAALAAAGLLLASACRLNPAFDEESTGTSGSGASGSDSSGDTVGDSDQDPTGTGGDGEGTGTGGATGGGSTGGEGGTSDDGGGSTGDDGSTSGDGGSSTGGGSSTSDEGCSEPPDFPDPAGPYDEFTITNAELDGSGEPWLVVEPGQVVELRFDYETSICSCPDCIVQGIVGFVEHSWRDCFYEGKPGCVGVQSQAVLTFAAPMEPGEYTLSFDRTLEYSCQPNLAVLLPGQAFAGVCVED